MQIHRTLFAWLLAAGLIAPGLSAQGAQRPNIVYIVADDLGWKDVGFHGGRPATPNLDALAAAGVRLERFYTLPYSTPTRAALMTGRYPMRYGLQTLSILPWSRFGLASDERLISQALLKAGYRTAAFGEWYLGHADEDYLPWRRGFEHFYGSLNGGNDHFRKTTSAGERDWWRDDQRITQEGYDTDLIADEAARFIVRHDPKQPMFVYVAFPAPAAPLQAPARYLEQYTKVHPEERRTYYAMIGALDSGVGKIVAALDSSGLRDNTLIIFHSDNGGAVHTKFETGDGDVPVTVAENGPFYGGKGSMHEGGVRVVALASWPSRIRPAVISERIHVTDLYPTLLKLAEAPLDPESQVKPIDGIDMWAVIAEGKPSPREEMLINVQEFRGAICLGNWKLIVYAPLPARYELYNVLDDPSEEDNRADREPQRVQQLLRRLNDFAWEMAPSLYLSDLPKARGHDIPIYWGENPERP